MMAKWEEVSISEARASLGEIASQVHYQGGSVMLTKNGKAIAAIVQPEVAIRLEDKARRYREALESLRLERLGTMQTANALTPKDQAQTEEARRIAGQKALAALEAIRASGIGSEMSDDEWEKFVQREVDAARAARRENASTEPDSVPVAI